MDNRIDKCFTVYFVDITYLRSFFVSVHVVCGLFCKGFTSCDSLASGSFEIVIIVLWVYIAVLKVS